ncbi:MAG: HAD hydrolase family protein [Akkermansia sp.]|nr:HAD hydrolase family protein [Akkermansia sp.]
MHVEEGQVLPGRALPFQGPCRWLLSFDYDETLRTNDPLHPVPPAFFELMRSWRSMGIRWGINTGRSLPYLCGELLPCSPFLPDFICTCERFAYVAQADGALSPLSGHNALCHQHNMEVRERICPGFHAQLDVLRVQCPHLEWIIADEDPLSVEAVDSATMDAIMAYLVPYIDTLEGVAAQRAGRYMRLADSRYCKGSALQVVAREWQVPSARWVMLGDGHNDLHAFRLFPQAFCAAPATAHPDVLAYLRAHGGYVSPASGVLEILRTWHEQIMTEQV